MKKFISFMLLIGMCSSMMIGCKNNTASSTKNPGTIAENSITSEELPQEVSKNSSVLARISMDDIRWEQWETKPIQVERVILLDHQEKYENRYLYYFMGTYPKVVGLDDAKFEDQINQWIKDLITPDIDSLRGSYFYSIKEVSEFEKENEKLDNTKLGSREYRYYVSYKILLLNSKMISILLDTYYWCEGVHGYNRAKIITIDLIKKKKLEEKELFLPNVNYWKILKPIVSKLVVEQENEIAPYEDIRAGFFDDFNFNDIIHYFHFGLSPENLVVSLDDTGNIGFNRMFVVKIPYQELRNISLYSSFENSYSCFTYPENWTGFSYTNEIQEEHGKGLSIKYPEIKDINGKVNNFETLIDGIKIEIPFGNEKAVMQIDWKDLETEFDIPPLNIQVQPTEQELNEKSWESWEQIDGVWFKKSGPDVNNVIKYLGVFINTEYQVKIQIPSSVTEQNKKEVIDKINQVLGTLRVG